MSTTIHTIGIAGILVARAPERVRTVLGSCIGIALFDRTRQVGGMSHVILPSSAEGSGDPGKFADTAVAILIEQITQAGGVRGKLAAKIAGGARMFGSASQTGLGERNATAVKDILREQMIPLVAEDCGGEKGRKITLDPASGDLEVQIIGREPKTI